MNLFKDILELLPHSEKRLLQELENDFEIKKQKRWSKLNHNYNEDLEEFKKEFYLNKKNHQNYLNCLNRNNLNFNSELIIVEYENGEKDYYSFEEYKKEHKKRG